MVNVEQYNSKVYWEWRGKCYHAAVDAVETSTLCEFVRTHVDPGKSIAEIGSGYGRVYLELQSKGLLHARRFTAFDFVQSMREQHFAYTGHLPVVWDGERIPCDDGEYDMVISASVLLHVPPEDIDRVFAEHVRITARFIYVSTYTGPSQSLSPHVFKHDYPRLINDHNLHTVQQIIFEPNGLRTNWLLEVRE